MQQIFWSCAIWCQFDHVPTSGWCIHPKLIQHITRWWPTMRLQWHLCLVLGSLAQRHLQETSGDPAVWQVNSGNLCALGRWFGLMVMWWLFFFFNFGAVFHAVGHWLVYWLSCVAGVWLFLMGDAFAASSHQRFWVQHFRIANRAGSTQLNETPGLQLCNCGGQASCRTTGFFRFGCLLDRFLFFFKILPTFSEVYLESTSPQNLPCICPEAFWNPKLFRGEESQRNPGNPNPENGGRAFWIRLLVDHVELLSLLGISD